MATRLTHSDLPAQTPMEIETEEDRVAALRRRWLTAIARGAAEDMEELLAERSVLILPNGDPVKGPEAVVGAWHRIFALPGLHLSVQPVRTNLYPTGDVAHDIGRYRLRFENGSGESRDHGNHLLVWERKDGDWQVRSNVFYSRSLEDVRLLPG